MISALVPLRDTGGGHRARLWAFIRARLEAEMPDVEIVMGTDDGADPFNKCMAVNRAAAAASGDVLYILDADCYVPPEQVRAAARELTDRNWTRPWSRKVKLSEAQTMPILAQDPLAWDGTWDTRARPERVNTFWSAPPLMLRRASFEDVGGMDERYRGWGGEDNAFARALWKIGYGLAVRIRGDCIHLWHPRIGDYGKDLWPGQAEVFSNRFLDREYQQARTPAEMRRLIDSRGDR